MVSITLDDVRLFLHVVAATIWVGGQLTLAGLVPALRRAGADVPKQVAAQFSRIAWPAFGVLILTGVWNAIEVRHHISSSASYRATFFAKLGFVVLSGVSAFLHQRASTRRANAIWGAATALFALLALFWGIILNEAG